MADLLALPPELLKKVVHELVLDIGVRGVAKLRGVCRQLEQHISDNLFVLQPQQTFQRPADRVVLTTRLDDFVITKTKAVQHDFNPFFIEQVLAMVDYLIHELELPEQAWESLMPDLCSGLKTIIGEYNIALAIMGGDETKPERMEWWEAFDGSFDDCVKLAAAMSIRCYDLVEHLLPEISEGATSRVYGIPLVNAVKLGDLRLVNLIIKYLDSLRLQKRKSIPHRYRVFNGHDTAFPVYDAILTSINRDDLNIAKALIDLYKKQIYHIGDGELNVWLEAAIDQGSIEMVQAISVIPRKSSFKIGFPHMGWLFATGDYNLVSTVFALTSGPLTHRASAQHPLHIAVRSGRVDSVRAIIDTGRVEINMLVTSNIPNYSRTPITALDVAINHGHVALMEYLIAQGAVSAYKIPVMPVPGYIYKLLRQASQKRNGGATFMPEAGQWKSMDRDERRFFMGG